MDFARAYLSNVCVAKELHRNGVGYKLIDKSKRVAGEWGKKNVLIKFLRFVPIEVEKEL